MSDFYTLLTNAGIEYETACKAKGLPIKLSRMSVGDGNGAVYNPDATAVALKREVWRGDINALLQDADNPSWLVAELDLPAAVGGWYVREAGIWTDTGILYAIIKYPESYKPVMATAGAGKEFYIRAIFQTTNASNVTLVVDENVVKATRAWVGEYVAGELAKLDYKPSVRAVAVAPIELSGPQSIDGVALVAGDLVLVTAQAAARNNGIYVVAVGAWSRAPFANSVTKVTPGLIVGVEEGASYAETLWMLAENAPINVGVTALTFQIVGGRFASLPEAEAGTSNIRAMSALRVAQAAQKGAALYGEDVGAVNAYSVPYAPAVAALYDGMVLRFKAKQANTGASTFAPNGLPPKPLVNVVYGGLQPDDIVVNSRCEVMYLAGGDFWVLVYASGQVLRPSRRMAKFTASGSWTCPVGVTQVLVDACGAGAGGSGSNGNVNAGQGGGGGACIKDQAIAVTPGQTYSVTIGKGGRGGVVGADGTNGGLTSLGALFTLNGGVAGSKNGNGFGDSGGWGGQPGSDAFALGGSGGSSLFGIGGTSRQASGVPGTGYGAGGSGGAANMTGWAGAPGSDGFVLIRW